MNKKQMATRGQHAAWCPEHKYKLNFVRLQASLLYTIEQLSQSVA